DQSVRDRFPFFATGDRDLAALIPLTRDRVTAILDELNDFLTPLALDVNALQDAMTCVEAGDAALSSGDARAALHQFDQACVMLVERSRRISALSVSAVALAGATPELERRQDEMLGEEAKAVVSPEAARPPENETARMLEEAGKQLSDGNYDRAAWLAENI